MRYVLILLIILFQIVSCKKKEKQKTLLDNFDANGATLISQSHFTSNTHTTSGCIKLYSKNSAKNLVFEGFKTESGPDLRVYFSRTTNNTAFIEAGKLKATNGNFYYTVDGSVNTVDYKYVLIWCEDYSVLFGNAQL